MYPIHSETLGELFNRIAAENGDQEALLYEDGRRYTWSQLKERVDEVAKGLIAFGVEKGDKVGVWHSNSPEWIFFHYAIAKVGAILLPINTRFREKDLEYILNQSDLGFLIVGKPNFKDISYFDRLLTLCPEIMQAEPGNLRSKRIPTLRTVLTINEVERPGTYTFDELIERGKYVDDEVLDSREASVNVDDTFMIMYTSGTTGFPKGVMHCHRFLKNIKSVAERLRVTSDDRIMLYLPLFHAYALITVMTTAHTKGAKIILMEHFEAEKALQIMDQEKATSASSFEAMILDMINHPHFNKYSIDSLRFGICAVPEYAARMIQENMMPVFNAYGSTEVAAIATLSSVEDPVEKRMTSCGRPLPDILMKIVDPETQIELPTNQHGEICIKAFTVMQGYYKNPEETAKAVDSEGWFHTGDLGYVDDEGYYHIVGRVKDMIRVGGENVDPVEVEAYLTTHPAVYRCSVVAYPDPRLSEVCFAFVQLGEGQKVEERELIEYCQGKIASFKIPRHIVFSDEFPMTPSGKIRKVELRQMALQLKDGKNNVTKGELA